MIDERKRRRLVGDLWHAYWLHGSGWKEEAQEMLNDVVKGMEETEVKYDGIKKLSKKEEREKARLAKIFGFDVNFLQH